MNKDTEKEIEAGLTDDRPEVRIAFAERKDFTPTPEQIERGLNDQDSTVRGCWLLTKKDITVKNLEEAKNDVYNYIIYMFRYLKSYNITPEQIESGLNHEDYWAREAFKKYFSK